MKTLLAGPDCSLEMGWLVCTWIPAIRRKAKDFNKVIIACKKGHDYLYEDFADKIIHFNKAGHTDRWLLNGESVCLPKKIRRKYRGAIYYAPSEKKCTQWKRKYVMYGSPNPDLHYDVVIHARATNKYDTGGRNWPIKKYVQLIDKLNGAKICSIGTKAYHVPGTNDKRRIPMKDLCDLLYNSKMIVGPSSGPLHLASLCGCNQVVWTHRQWLASIHGTNRDRYTKKWRPFSSTRVRVIDGYGWAPPVKTVLKKVRELL